MSSIKRWGARAVIVAFALLLAGIPATASANTLLASDVNAPFTLGSGTGSSATVTSAEYASTSSNWVTSSTLSGGGTLTANYLYGTAAVGNAAKYVFEYQIKNTGPALLNSINIPYNGSITSAGYLTGAHSLPFTTNGTIAPADAGNAANVVTFDFNAPNKIANTQTSNVLFITTNDAGYAAELAQLFGTKGQLNGSLVAPVPVPATMAMLLSGLPCLGAIGFILNRKPKAAV